MCVCVCARLAELGRQLEAMQTEAVHDIHVSVEQFRDHLDTTVQALHESTTQLAQSFTYVTSLRLLTRTLTRRRSESAYIHQVHHNVIMYTLYTFTYAPP